MLFRNKKTELVWEVSNQEHQSRLIADEEYEVVEEVVTEKSEQLTEQTDEQLNQEIKTRQSKKVK